ncbi:hypothetical protein NLI96_g2932 [Meripilus lineatus]|uniref:Cytochrome P450 n=1 Tax=Meripilus lineatus TaxID=2056292 RepID=A0AAD5YLI4_9APHY|nr:hypothetical protein NLI96_g2932 [Physisporinus lineatus]
MSIYLVHFLASCLSIYVLWRYYEWLTGKGLHAIPTVGPSAPGFSYIGTFRILRHGKDMVERGYRKYKGGTFKIALADRWLVVFSGTQLVQGAVKFPDEKFSFSEAISELIQIKYTLGKSLRDDPYHVEIIRSQLTRHIARELPAIHDEIVEAFTEVIPPREEWTAVLALPAMGAIVARVSNRVFLGLPMCRNLEYLRIAVSHTIDIVNASNYLSFFPHILKPFASALFNASQQSFRDGVRLLRPLIEDRLQRAHEQGKEWPGKPWIIDEAVERKQNVEEIVRRLLFFNFAAIHTSSNSFTHALYHLAANPEYMKPLRDEAEAVIKEEGWTKAGMRKLRRLDSFMKESLRLNGINCTSLTRKALTEVTLSDGTFIPAGTICVAASGATHTDDENYPNALDFSPFRFSEMREKEGENIGHQFVTTASDYISFGHGRHACPGRFFAANELKAMMTYLVLTYDVKFGDEGVRPPNRWFGFSVTPCPDTPVLFRKRRI